MKAKHQRLIFVGVSVVFLCIATLFTLRAFRENLVFFYSPSDLTGQAISPDTLVRVGGLVESGSIEHNPDGRVLFRLTDGKATIAVAYKGLLPSLFRDGQGSIAEGYLDDKNHLRAVRVLAKHDEKYMPKEVVDALKRSGHWHEPK